MRLNAHKPGRRLRPRAPLMPWQQIGPGAARADPQRSPRRRPGGFPSTLSRAQVATFCLALYNLLAGVLGENLVLPSIITQDIWGFILVNGTAVTVCIALFFWAWSTMIKRKMI
jgi:hypothetical protein